MGNVVATKTRVIGAKFDDEIHLKQYIDSFGRPVQPGAWIDLFDMGGDRTDYAFLSPKQIKKLRKALKEYL